MLKTSKNSHSCVHKRRMYNTVNYLHSIYKKMKLEPEIVKMSFFFYLSFLSRAFTIHRTGGKGKGYLLNSSLPLPFTHRHLDISWVVTPETSPLHIASSQTWARNLWFPSASWQLLRRGSQKWKKYVLEKESLLEWNFFLFRPFVFSIMVCF